MNFSELKTNLQKFFSKRDNLIYTMGIVILSGVAVASFYVSQGSNVNTSLQGMVPIVIPNLGNPANIPQNILPPQSSPSISGISVVKSGIDYNFSFSLSNSNKHTYTIHATFSNDAAPLKSLTIWTKNLSADTQWIFSYVSPLPDGAYTFYISGEYAGNLGAIPEQPLHFSIKNGAIVQAQAAATITIGNIDTSDPKNILFNYNLSGAPDPTKAQLGAKITAKALNFPWTSPPFSPNAKGDGNFPWTGALPGTNYTVSIYGNNPPIPAVTKDFTTPAAKPALKGDPLIKIDSVTQAGNDLKIAYTLSNVVLSGGGLFVITGNEDSQAKPIYQTTSPIPAADLSETFTWTPPAAGDYKFTMKALRISPVAVATSASFPFTVNAVDNNVPTITISNISPDPNDPTKVNFSYSFSNISVNKQYNPGVKVLKDGKPFFEDWYPNDDLTNGKTNTKTIDKITNGSYALHVLGAQNGSVKIDQEKDFTVPFAPSNPTLSCAPDNATHLINESVTWTATVNGADPNANPSYSWFADQAHTQSLGKDSTYTESFDTPQTATIYVQADDKSFANPLTANCSVTINSNGGDNSTPTLTIGNIDQANSTVTFNYTLSNSSGNVSIFAQVTDDNNNNAPVKVWPLLTGQKDGANSDLVWDLATIGNFTFTVSGLDGANTIPKQSSQFVIAQQNQTQTLQQTQEKQQTQAQTQVQTPPPAPPAQPTKPVSNLSKSGVPYPKDVYINHWAYALIRAAYDAGFVQGYPNGTFRPDKPIKRDEAIKMGLVMFVKPASCYTTDCGTPFTDLNQSLSPWVRKAWEMKIVKGYGGVTFGANNLMTRGEAVAFIAKLAYAMKIIPEPFYKGCYTVNCGAGYPNIFKDITNIATGAYLKELLNFNPNIVQGVSKGKFNPNAPITRAELLKILLKLKDFQQ